MKILERLVQKICADKWMALEKLDAAYNAVEGKYNLPSKRRYRMLFGGQSTDMLVIEREWESFAVMESTMQALMADPEYQKVSVESMGIIEENRWEIYMVL